MCESQVTENIYKKILWQTSTCVASVFSSWPEVQHLQPSVILNKIEKNK